VAVNDDDGESFVLSLRAAGLGDLLTAVPALRAISAAYPEARHVLATSAGLHELAPLIGGVDLLVHTVVEDGAPPPLVPVDVAINLHGCGPQSHRMLLASQPRRLIAFGRDDLRVDGPEWNRMEHEVIRWCRLLEESGIPADPDDLDFVAPPGRLPAGVRGATVLHPGAGAAARRWPIERWTALAAAEVADGHRVVVTVGPRESSLGDAIAAAVPGVSVVDCSRDLGLLLRVIDVARVVVVADTGVAHVATALRTPSVVLFGPEPPSRWGPPPDRPWHVALWSGQHGDPHGETTDAGLLELSVLDVLLAVRHVRDAYGGLPGGVKVRACAS
jgi:ADP-heptose:LPS heptosyltransferase